MSQKVNVKVKERSCYNDKWRKKEKEWQEAVKKVDERHRESELIRQAKNNYQNSWRHAHKDRVREYNQNYWRKKVLERQKQNANRDTN